LSPNVSPRRPDARRASVLLIGVGALGCPAAAALTRAGVGTITLLDPDRVELSNLQRQPLFRDADIGRPKVEIAAARLRDLGSLTSVVARQERFEDGMDGLVGDHDLVIDACDDPIAKLQLNAAAVRTRTPLIYGGVVRTSGQTMPVVPGTSACLECVFADDGRGDAGSCSEMGILAPVAGVIGALQALSALRILGGDRSGAGRMVVYSLTGRRWRQIAFSRDELCPACGARPPVSDDPRRQVTCRS